MGFDKTQVFRPVFNLQFACDRDSPFLLGYDVFAALSDAHLLGPMLERTEALSGLALEVVLNDNKYASILNLKLCDDGYHDVCSPAGHLESTRGGSPTVG